MLNKPKVDFQEVAFRLIGPGVLGILFFTGFYFLPERLMIASLLIVFLIVFLNRISKPKIVEQIGLNDFPKTNVTKTQQTPIRQSSEFDISRQFRRGFTEKKSVKISKANGNDILNLHEGERQGLSRFIRIRSRVETNDRLLDERIKDVFDNIREADEDNYCKGLAEIRRLLVLRQNSLGSLTSNKEVS